MEICIPRRCLCADTERECFIPKCSGFEGCHRIVGFKFSIFKTICNSELICSTDIAMIPHVWINIREAFFSSYFRKRDSTCSEENREYFSSCDIIFYSITTITVPTCQSLILEVEHGVTIPRVLYIREVSKRTVKRKKTRKKRNKEDFFCIHSCLIVCFSHLNTMLLCELLVRKTRLFLNERTSSFFQIFWMR